MATIIELGEHTLFKLDPWLDEDEQPERMIYGSERFKNWVEQTLPGLGSTWQIEVTPEEQFDDLAHEFCSGAVLTYRHRFWPIHHVGGGVWELKTADLRIFGWFPHKNCFVAVVADTAERIKLHGLYHGYAGEVVRFRDALNLDQPKFIVGDDPDAVVSNYAFPPPPSRR